MQWYFHQLFFKLLEGKWNTNAPCSQTNNLDRNEEKTNGTASNTPGFLILRSATVAIWNRALCTAAVAVARSCPLILLSPFIEAEAKAVAHLAEPVEHQR